jgi:hypothetical protein
VVTDKQSSQYLSSLPPVQQGRIADLPVHTFFTSASEKNMLKQCYIAQVLEVIKEHVPPLAFLAKYGPSRPEAIVKKDEIHNVHVLPWNEQKYQDMIMILQEYEDFVESVFAKAGKTVDNCTRIHVGGDQLTRERISGAKGLVVVEESPKASFQHLTPVTFELFHLQMNVLTLLYKVLYKDGSVDTGTMAAEKIRLARDNVKLEVKHHYDACKDFAISFVNCYIVEALCHFLGMEDVKSTPTKIALPPKNSSSEAKTQWVQTHLGQFVDLFVVNPPSNMQVNPGFQKITTLSVHLPDGSTQILQIPLAVNKAPVTQPDAMNNYGYIVLEIGMLFKELLNVCHNPNRPLFLGIMKDTMLHLKAENSRSKYALEILRLLFHQYAGLSEQDAIASFQGLFVNTSGKPGKNIPADLAMEHNVRKTKDILKTMGPHKTPETIRVRTGAMSSLSNITENYTSATGCYIRRGQHKIPSAHGDEVFMLNDLRSVQPFKMVPGRTLSKFKLDSKSMKSKANHAEVTSWINSKKYVYDIEHGK